MSHLLSCSRRAATKRSRPNCGLAGFVVGVSLFFLLLITVIAMAVDGTSETSPEKVTEAVVTAGRTTAANSVSTTLPSTPPGHVEMGEALCLVRGPAGPAACPSMPG
jgi:hypothetical protein